MAETHRIQRRRTKGFKLSSPDGRPVVCVTRPGPWGNPFKGPHAVRLFKLMVGRRWAELERRLRAWEPSLTDLQFLMLMMEFQMRAHWIQQNLHTLRGKTIACWCGLDKPCHADALIEELRRENRKAVRRG